MEMMDDERIEELKNEVVRLRARLESLEREARSGSLSSGLRRSRVSRGVMAALAGLALAPLVAWAVDLPYVFVNGNVADANQVNANFSALEAAVNDHIADTTIHHPPITSINGLLGGTINGNVTVTGFVNTPEVQGSTLRLRGTTLLELEAGTVARVNSGGIIDLNGGSITLN